jgi:branched-subunit amino acid transport protein
MNSFLLQPVLSSQFTIWLTIILAGWITYAIRLSFIVLFSRWEVPDLLRRALQYVPPAVLTAIILPELLIRDGAVDVSLGNARLLAGLMAILVAWRTKNVFLTIIAGMAILWLLQWIF